MISECTKNDSSKILYIINDAAARYKGIIPDDCWHEPYMSEQELIDEFSDGVRMYGYHHNNKAGVSLSKVVRMTFFVDLIKYYLI